MDRFVDRLKKNELTIKLPSANNHSISSKIKDNIAIISFIVGSIIAIAQATTGYLQYQISKDIESQTTEIKNLATVAEKGAKRSLAEATIANKQAKDNLNEIEQIIVQNQVLLAKLDITNTKNVMMNTTPKLFEAIRLVDLPFSFQNWFLSIKSRGFSYKILVPVANGKEAILESQTWSIIKESETNKELKSDIRDLLEQLATQQEKLCILLDKTKQNVQNCYQKVLAYTYFEYINFIVERLKESYFLTLVEAETVTRQAASTNGVLQTKEQEEFLKSVRESFYHPSNMRRFKTRFYYSRTKKMLETIIRFQDHVNQAFLDDFYNSLFLTILKKQHYVRLKSLLCNQLALQNACNLTYVDI